VEWLFLEPYNVRLEGQQSEIDAVLRDVPRGGKLAYKAVLENAEGRDVVTECHPEPLDE